MSKSRDQVIEYLKKIDITGKTVLDVGAGPEDKWTIHTVKGKPLMYKTLDFNPEFNCDFVYDLNVPCTAIDIAQKFSEVVFCIETLEHVWNPVVAMENLSKWTGEVCYITTPFINPLHDTVDFLRYTVEWFELVGKKYFREVNIIPRVATAGKESLENFYSLEGLRMSKVTKQMGYSSNYLDIGYIVECIK